MNQVGSCSIEVKTIPVKPSILVLTLTTLASAFVACVLLASYLPFLVRFSMGVLA